MQQTLVKDNIRTSSLKLVLMYFLGAIFAVSLIFFASTQSAHADIGGNVDAPPAGGGTGGSGGSGGTGGGNGGGGGGGGGGGIPADVNLTITTKSGSTYCGAGWTPGTGCGLQGGGGAGNISTSYCANSYQLNWSQTTYSYSALNGAMQWNKVGPIEVTCLYPSISYNSERRYYDYQAQAKYSIDRNRDHAGWDVFGTRSPQAGDPGTPSGGYGKVGPSGGATSLSYNYYLPVDKLGYYSVYFRYLYKTYTQKVWSWPGGSYYDWSNSGPTPGNMTKWWVYSCMVGAPNATEGAYPNQGSLPNRDANLNPATCEQVSWQCKIDVPSTAGLDRAAVMSGAVNSRSTVTVMRNGEQVPITWANVRVVDTSGANDIDVTNGNAPVGVISTIRNVSNIAYNTNVKGGSSPFNGTDANAADQYFKQYNKFNSATLEKFNTWTNKANSNLDKGVAFYWASESADKTFAMERTFKVTAEFRIPKGQVISANDVVLPPRGVGGFTSFVWRVGTYDCKDYAGRGRDRIDRGILKTTTNPIAVVRATNK